MNFTKDEIELIKGALMTLAYQATLGYNNELAEEATILMGKIEEAQKNEVI